MFPSLFPHGMAQYAIGGSLIGLGIAMLYLTTGRPGGISTFFSASWSWVSNNSFFQQASMLSSRNWRVIYALGLILGGTLYALLGLPMETSQVPLWKLAAGGLLIGFGARLGGGCTSGHGICGIASLSMNSVIMVITFLSTAIATAWIIKLAGA
jgi:uncharacterized protein